MEEINLPLHLSQVANLFQAHAHIVVATSIVSSITIRPSPPIHPLNSALQAFLQTNYPAMVAEGQPAISALMWLLAKKHSDEFLEDPEDHNSVVRFTDLRKLALCVLAQKCALPEPQAVAEAAFQAWHDAR